MTDPLIPEVVRLKGGLRAVYISRELAEIQRRVADAIVGDAAEGREPL